MRYPLLLNTNDEIQDADGRLLSRAFYSRDIGLKVVSDLNEIELSRGIGREVQVVDGEGLLDARVSVQRPMVAKARMATEEYKAAKRERLRAHAEKIRAIRKQKLGY